MQIIRKSPLDGRKLADLDAMRAAFTRFCPTISNPNVQDDQLC